VYSGHLRRQHHLELIPRLNTFHDGKDKIESALVKLASLRTGISQLTEETVVEIEIRRPRRLTNASPSKGSAIVATLWFVLICFPFA